MKYNITKEDLKKRNYNITYEFINNDFLLFIEKEKKRKNSFLCPANISKLEKETLKNINLSIYVFTFFGFLSLFYGLYVFIKLQPSLAVNGYTQFPYIDNGSVPLVLGLACILGSIYSYLKRDAVLVTKVKAKIIEHLKKEYAIKPMPISKKRKRFRQKFTGHKKKR